MTFQASLFEAQRSIVQSSIKQIALGGEEEEPRRRQNIKQCLESIGLMGQMVRDNQSEIATYTLQQYKEQITRLTVELNEVRAVLLHKKGFHFSTRNLDDIPLDLRTPRRKRSNIIRDSSLYSGVESDNRSVIPPKTNNTTSNIDSQWLSIQDKASTYTMQEVKNSVIRIQSPTAIQMIRVSSGSNSFIWVESPVKGSIYITKCTGCIFVLSQYQQLRIHSSSHLVISGGGGGAILENCHDISFAPSYSQIDDFSSLAHSTNYHTTDTELQRQISDALVMIQTQASETSMTHVLQLVSSVYSCEEKK